MLAVIRKTYGFGKKSDVMSNWQLAQMTGIDRWHVSKSIKELANINVLTVHETGTVSRGQSLNEIGINKNYSEWLTVHKTGTVVRPSTKRGIPQNVDGDRPQNVEKPSMKRGHSKESKESKETKSTRARKNGLDLSEIPGSISLVVVSEFIEHRIKKKSPLTQRALDRALSAAVGAGERFGKSPNEIIEDVIDAGWQGINIAWLENRYRSNGNGTHQQDTRSRAKRVSDKLDEIAAAADAEEVGGGAVQAVSGEVAASVDKRH